MRHSLSIKAEDIARLAEDSYQFAADLPILLRRLIFGTVDNLHKVYFPSGKNVYGKGYDGIVESSEGNAFVPNGRSVWEISTRRDVIVKANKDFEERTYNSKEDNFSVTTYVCVTAHKWQDKEAWVASKKKEEKWLDVKVIDAVDLECWLENAPVAESWFAPYVDKWPISGVLTLEKFWEEWSKKTNPAIHENLLLAGRQKEADELNRIFRMKPKVQHIYTESKKEAIAFMAACILILPEEEKERLLSMCIIVSNIEDWRFLTECKKKLFLIVNFANPPGAANVINNGHYIVVPKDTSSKIERKDLVLPRPTIEEFFKALQKMGFEEYQARKIARESGGSISAIMRKLAIIKQ